MSKRVSMPTAIVQMAQKRYPQILAAAVAHIGVDPAYGQQKLDARTYDQRLVRMLPDQLAALAQSDPQAYQDATTRLGKLQDQPDTLPAQGTWEGTP